MRNHQRRTVGLREIKRFGKGVRALVKTQHYGDYHAFNTGKATQFTFAKAILELAEKDTKLQPCASTEFPSVVQRPAYSVLDISKLAECIAGPMRPWRIALAEYMERREG